jgi:hypothetical protein
LNKFSFPANWPFTVVYLCIQTNNLLPTMDCCQGRA